MTAIFLQILVSVISIQPSVDQMALQVLASDSGAMREWLLGGKRLKLWAWMVAQKGNTARDERAFGLVIQSFICSSNRAIELDQQACNLQKLNENTKWSS